MNPFLQDLKQRGLLQDITPGLEEQLNKEMTSGYIGFDPTADSLHIGNLAQIILLRRFQKAGHKPYVLIGGATGLIGDPSGKANERSLLMEEAVDDNSMAIQIQLKKLLDFSEDLPNCAVLKNNESWTAHKTFLDFIREVGKYITVSYMLSKDSVKSRLENGLSFTEFSYQLIQAYDFYYLYRKFGVKLQMGGSDQWGNITTGIDYIHKRIGKTVFAFVSPLVTKNDGSKFGKSEKGNIWLDRKKTSPYQFYQSWLNLTDEDAIKLLPIFSMHDMESISSGIEKHKQSPNSRLLQFWLAAEMTELVHSKEDLDQARESSEILFGKGPIEALQKLPETRLTDILQGIPSAESGKNVLNGEVDVITFLFETGIFSSKGEARKMIANNGVSINKERITDKFLIKKENLLHDKYLLVQKGKKFHYVQFH